MIKRLVFAVLICLLMPVFFPETASAAAGILDNPPAFEEGLPQEGKYIKDAYRSNYSLDIEDPGLLGAGDSALNGIANIFFNLILFLGHLVTIAFYRASEFDLVILFSKQIQDILKTLDTTFFKGFFILAVAFAACQIVIKMIKDNISGMVQDLVKIIIMCVISVLVVTNASWILSSTSSLTKELSAKVLMDISGVKTDSNSSTSQSYTAASCTALWKSLVHDPWISLEFSGLKPDEETIEKFLSTAPGSDERQTLVKDYKSKHKDDEPTIFDKTLGGGRIAILIVYIIPFLLKAILIGGLSLAQIFLQFCAIGVLILAPAIILLAVIPYFGFPLIGSWLKKILDFHISMIALAFALGLFLRFDTMLYGMATGVGWLFVIIIELGIAVAIILNIKHILRGISALTQAAQNPSSAFSGRIANLQSMSMPRRWRQQQQRPRLDDAETKKKTTGMKNNRQVRNNNGNQRSGSSSRPVSRRPSSKPSISRPSQPGKKYKIKDGNLGQQPKTNTPKESNRNRRKPDVNSMGLKGGFEAPWQDKSLQQQQRQRRTSRPKSSQPPRKRSA